MQDDVKYKLAVKNANKENMFENMYIQLEKERAVSLSS